MNKSKTIISLFLSVILVTGTIAAISPIFILKGVNAQGDPYYGGMDNSYEDRKSYVMDDSYDDRKLYDKKLYRNDDSYESQYSSYGKDDKRDKSKEESKSVDIKKIKCINTNLNINGNNTADINVGNKGQGYFGAYSSGVNGEGYNGYNDGYDKQNKGFECIINNNNTNTNIITGGGNQTIPSEKRATLNVTKLVTCQQEERSNLVPSIQQISLDCDDLLALITEDQFNITVTDTDVIPPNFNGSEIGTLVTLNEGPFTVTEEPYDSVAEELATFEDIQTNATGPFPSFSGDCSQTGVNSTSATGIIAAGESQNCKIENNFVINLTDPCEHCFLDALGPENFIVFEEFLAGVQPVGASNYEEYCALIQSQFGTVPIDTITNNIVGELGAAGITLDPVTLTALVQCLLAVLNGGTDNGSVGISTFDTHDGGTADSDDLTAMEKIIKLKTQWLNQLP